jgi:hypothetical protein
LENDCVPAGIAAGFVVSGGTGGEVPMAWWMWLAVVAILVVVFIAILGAEDRHAKMTEEEFEEEAKRNSMIGAGIVELQKAFQPQRVKQYVEEKNRVKEESSFSGDPPPDPLIELEEEPGQEGDTPHDSSQRR